MTEGTNQPPSCLYCIDGLATSTSALLGACFRICLACQPTCPCCQGNGCFPADTTDMAVFIAHHNAAGRIPVLCHTCGGVIDLYQPDQETSS